MTYYAAPHLSQYDYSSYTARYGCTWTAGANGVGATTGGRKRPSPDTIHGLLPRYQETDPNSPGWSIPDLQRALSRYGMSFGNHSGGGWRAVIDQLEGGHYCVVQGDSDQFGNATCSGDFDGNHCIGINPRHRTYNGQRQWWIDDGICPNGRWEYQGVLSRYATDLSVGVMFGSFVTRVPLIDSPTAPTTSNTGVNNVTIRYAGVQTVASRMALGAGQHLYNKPGGSVVTSMSRTATVPNIGRAGSVNGKAWRAVLIGTSAGYSDGKAHRTILYVPASAGKVIPNA